MKTGRDGARLSRRAFLAALLGLAGGLLDPRTARAQHGAFPLRGRKDYLVWAQLVYPGSWNPNPRAARRFLSVLERRTSIEASDRAVPIRADDPELFERPFLYVAGRGRFPELSPADTARLARYVEHGGFLFFDDASGVPDSGFFEAVDALVRRIAPGRALAPLPGDHTIFQSFYLIRRVAGRKLVRPFLHGLEVEDLTPVVFCSNDLGGAWDGDERGYTHPCVPGGERQREMAFRLGVNIVMYALTGNYKKDQVHIPFILKRRRGRRP